MNRKDELTSSAQAQAPDDEPTGPLRRVIKRALLALLALAAVVPVLLGLTAASASATTYSMSNVYLSPEQSPWLFLDVSGASQSPGTQVIQWSLTGGANQKWDFQHLPDGNQQIINANSGQCLTTDGVAGDGVYQFPCVGALSQEWRTDLRIADGNVYGIQSAWSGLYLDVYGASSSQGAVIDTWYWNGGDNQYFRGYQG
jgi:Ricin-type beta-trefoil lectin domain-like